jgi:hypothetical protein
MDYSQPYAIFVDRLITELAQYKSEKGQTHLPQTFPGLSASQTASLKPLMLTFHCLFPNDFLPALDILDRKLVRRIIYTDRSDATSSKTGEGIPLESEDIFLVISASAPPSLPGASSTTPSTRGQEKGYEVRLRAWNCSCPTFTLSAYRNAHQLPELVGANHPHVGVIEYGNSIAYPFGGTLARGTARSSPPACKHILACVLHVRCPELFRADGDGRLLVSMEELAGWCAGWGG